MQSWGQSDAEPVDSKAKGQLPKGNDLQQNQLLLNVSHELRTHMNGVIGMADLLQETNLSPQQREYVRTIRSAGDSLLHIVNDILDFSKIEAQSMSLDAHLFDLQQAIEGAIDLVTADALAKSTEIYYVVHPDVPNTLIGDMTRLRQILVNLLSNAVKFTQHGEIIVKVESKRLDGQQYQISFAVSDTGIGIPAHQQEQLFHPFRQIEPAQSGNSRGAGLGLAVSKQLVQLMGGDIWLESAAGQGTTFHFTIKAGGGENSAYQHRNTDRYLRNRTALVISTRATGRDLLTNYLKRWGMQALAVPNAATAAPLIQSDQPIDVVIVDTGLTDSALAKRELQILADQCASLDLRRATPLIALAPIYNQSKYAAIEGRPALNPLLPNTGLGDGDHADQGPQWLGKILCLAKPVKMWMLHEVLVQLFEGNATAATPLASATPVLAKSLRILLVEDNAVNQLVTMRILEQLGYQADLARSGAEALAAAQHRHYDLV
ncbi:MAG: hypothetical protein KDE50_02165, partial [Caldilineaceae bacterium]|nr:hypothetical protein [Caldilineaceae bacterium]